MILYDYKCRSCGYEFEAANRMAECDSQPCLECGGGCEILIKSRAAAYHAFEEDVFHADYTTPVTISDRHQMKEFCKRYGKYAPGILDG